jgi:hypothetical protein
MTLRESARVIPEPECSALTGDDALISDVVAAHEAGWDVELYLQARGMGIGSEMLAWAVNECGFEPDWYVRARRAGSTNEELVECRLLELGTFPYLIAREHGVTHLEFCEAYRVLVVADQYRRRLPGRDLVGYTDCIMSGATHRESLDAHNAGLSLTDYAVTTSLHGGRP